MASGRSGSWTPDEDGRERGEECGGSTVGLVLRGWDAGAARADNVALGASRDSTQAGRVLGMYLRGR